MSTASRANTAPSLPPYAVPSAPALAPTLASSAAPRPAPVPMLEEVHAPIATDGARLAPTLSVPKEGIVVHVADPLSEREGGRPHARALEAAERFVWVRARGSKDVLWAMERALSCPAVSLVVGEVYGNPSALDFTASRRLAMAAERHGTRCVLVRMGEATRGASAARRRWQLVSLPSAPHPHDDRAPGPPRWHATLSRARGEVPGAWSVGFDGLEGLLRGVRPSGDDARNGVPAASSLAAPPPAPVPPGEVLVALDAIRARRGTPPDPGLREACA